MLRVLGSFHGILFVWLVVVFVALQYANGFTATFNVERNNVIKKIDDRRIELKRYKEMLTVSAVNCLNISKKIRGSQADTESVNAAIYDLKSTINQVKYVLDADSILTEYQSYMHQRSNNRQISKDSRLFKYFEHSFLKLSEIEALLESSCNDLNGFANAVAYKAGVTQSIASDIESYRQFKSILPEQKGFFWDDWNSLDTFKEQIQMLENMARTHNLFIQLRWQNIAEQLVMLEYLVADEPNDEAKLDNLVSVIQKDKHQGNSVKNLQNKLESQKR